MERREQREKRRRARERTKTETGSRPGDQSPYDILNVKPNATEKEIAAAYRKMAQMYHPDKVAGLGPEFKELAEERMKAINAAYAALGKPDRRVQSDRMPQDTEEARSDSTVQDDLEGDSTIIVSEDGLVIGGAKMAFPCSLVTLSRSIGAPSRMLPLEDNVYVWDELGIVAYEPPRAGITSVSLPIGHTAFRAQFSPKNLYGGSVQVGGYLLTAASDAKVLRAAGFTQGRPFSLSWRRRLGEFALLAEMDPGTQKIAFLSIALRAQPQPEL